MFRGLIKKQKRPPHADHTHWTDSSIVVIIFLHSLFEGRSLAFTFVTVMFCCTSAMQCVSILFGFYSLARCYFGLQAEHKWGLQNQGPSSWTVWILRHSWWLQGWVEVCVSVSPTLYTPWRPSDYASFWRMGALRAWGPIKLNTDAFFGAKKRPAAHKVQPPQRTVFICPHTHAHVYRHTFLPKYSLVP